VFVIVGGIAMVSLAAGTFAGHKEFGNFQDAGAVAAGIAAYAGKVPAALFALALIDASIIGAAAVGLSTAYAVGDVLSLRHSLHRKVTDAPAFYAVYVGLIGLAAALVLIPGIPLGLLTNAVQTLAGVLLPSATVFLLLLSNDAEVLGPWVNTRRTNIFTAVVIAVLVMLSVILTASVLFPSIGGGQILALLIAGALFALVAATAIAIVGERGKMHINRSLRATWRMPPLARLAPARLTPLNRMWLIVLRAYLVLAVVLVVVRVVQIALHRG
jgi:hypothetical protein